MTTQKPTTNHCYIIHLRSRHTRRYSRRSYILWSIIHVKRDVILSFRMLRQYIYYFSSRRSKINLFASR